jgi:hypothetical protein
LFVTPAAKTVSVGCLVDPLAVRPLLSRQAEKIKEELE